MHDKLFRYNAGWDYVGDLAMNFYECVLIQPIGKYPIGSQFSTVTVDYDKGVIELYNVTDVPGSGDEPVSRYRIMLSVREELQLDESTAQE